MTNITIDGSLPDKVTRIPPKMSVDSTGKIIWSPVYMDYNTAAYYRGKVLTSTEFNELFIQDVCQSNYITDSLKVMFEDYLGLSITRYFKSIYNLVPSYIKVIEPDTWGTVQDDGYYYITIPVEEHGFELTDTDVENTQVNIAVEMYLLDASNNFHEVSQYTLDVNNNIVVYSDDNTLTGFVVIRPNDKSYALAEPTIDATQVNGLAEVAISGNYNDLLNTPDELIATNATNIEGLLNGTLKAAKATSADNATDATNVSGTIQNIPISNIFEEGSSIVKNATNAENAVNATNAINAENAKNAENAITADMTQNAMSVNNLPIALRENSKLMFDGYVIPYKEILWKGEFIAEPPTGNATQQFYNLKLNKGMLNEGDWIEVKYKLDNSATTTNTTGTVKFQICTDDAGELSNNRKRVVTATAFSNYATSSEITINISRYDTVEVSNMTWRSTNGNYGKASATYYEIARIYE